MCYKTVANATKGFHIRWGTGIFPRYRNVSGPYVSIKRINQAKHIVAHILSEEEIRIVRAFQTFARKKYYNKHIKVDVDIQAAKDMINNTVLHTRDNELYGESDGEQIWISKIKMSGEILVGTMLHESLHNIATFNGKDICERDEHAIMIMLGEVLDY